MILIPNTLFKKKKRKEEENKKERKKGEKKILFDESEVFINELNRHTFITQKPIQKPSPCSAIDT